MNRPSYNVDLANVQELEAIVARLPAALMRRILGEGSPLTREKLLAPTFARMERERVVEQTGSCPEWPEDMALAYLHRSQPTDTPGSDET